MTPTCAFTRIILGVMSLFLRLLFHYSHTIQSRFVAKLNKKVVSRELFFEDVKMQMVARKWAAKYNDFGPPKRIDFLMSYVVELVDRTPEIITCGVEPYHK